MSKREIPTRKHARANVDWPVTVVYGNDTLQGKVKNISRGGALLYLPKNLEDHKQVRLAIEIEEFEDVITAKAEVVRTSSLITDNKIYSFSVAFKFTEISDEDLRYFTGNVAEEWHEDYKHPYQPKTKKYSIKSISYGLAIFVLICISLYSLRLNNKYKIDEKQLVQLTNIIGDIEKNINELQGVEQSIKNVDNKVTAMQDHIIAMQKKLKTFATVEYLQYKIDMISDIGDNINELQGVEQSIKNVDNKVTVMQDRIIAMQKKLTTFATVEHLQYQSERFENKIDKINHLVSPPRQAEIVLTPNNKKESDSIYYSVKRGDNLYRIGLKYGINVNKIKEMNSLSQDNSIYPGQKLIVGRRQ